MNPPEAAYLETIQEWKKACAHLASSVDMYLNACLTLGTACLDPLDTFKNASPVAQTLNDIDEEIHRMESDWHKLYRARAAISVARNRSPKLAPINALPREVLSHIFHLVVTSEFWYGSPVDAEYESGSTNNKIELPEYPGNLSTVCSFWHQLVENTPILWSRIHLVVSGSSTDAFFARASHFIKRAANTPLFICIHEPEGLYRDLEQLASWLAPVASQIHYLEAAGSSTTPETLDSALGCWFEHGAPGATKELSLQNTLYVQPNLIEPVPGPNPRLLQFNVSSERFADFLRPVTLLRLNGVFLPWNSQAFCGLEHLQLANGFITEAQFIAILSENARLRTLAFGLEIVEAKPRAVLQAPVHLPELEILNLNIMLAPTAIWSVLRLLAPSTRPLRVAFKAGETDQFYELAKAGEAQAFFQRSNVTICHLSARINSNNHWFSTLMQKLPHLRTLCTTGDMYFVGFLSHQQDGTSYVCPQLRELTIVNHKVSLDDFKEMLRAHSIQVLRLWGCDVFSRGSQVEGADLQEELSVLAPDVKTYDGEDGYWDPHLNWGYAQF
ncbi:hypothetical protein FRC10_010792 [Ceratobasidium sp. 414]|nr:hypothetical protein FRC10_010792 [Ceratobasidium sp. 414]